MKCPNCDKEMKDEGYMGLDWGYGMAGEEEYVWQEKHRCTSCKIAYKNEKWIIPKGLKPTEKQENTLLFINNRLGTGFKPLTKYQSWKIINKYFDKAKNTKAYDWYNNITDEDCDALGLDASMFY